MSFTFHDGIKYTNENSHHKCDEETGIYYTILNSALLDKIITEKLPVLANEPSSDPLIAQSRNPASESSNNLGTKLADSLLLADDFKNKKYPDQKSRVASESSIKPSIYPSIEQSTEPALESPNFDTFLPLANVLFPLDSP